MCRIRAHKHTKKQAIGLDRPWIGGKLVCKPKGAKCIFYDAEMKNRQ